MKVQVHPSDTGGCGHYRMIWPGLALAQAGYDVEVLHPDRPTPLKLEMIDAPVDGIVRPTIIRLAERPDADVVVFQRPLRRLMADVIPHLQKAGVAVVVELDDDFQSLSPRNSAWATANGKTDADRHWKHLRRACDLADWVTVSTPALAARYGAHGRVSVIRNAVPEENLTIAAAREARERPWLGWSGMLHTHPFDLQVAKNAVNRLARSGAVDVAVVGDGVGVAEQFGIHAVTASGWIPLPDYPEAIARFDIGMVPLELTPFNEAKSWLKGLELASVGVPFVATPTGEYAELARLGIGELAVSRDDWFHRLRNLAVDPDERAAIGARYRDRVYRHGLTVEEHAGEWWAAWHAASNRAAARRAAA